MWPLTTCIPIGAFFNIKTQMEFDFYYQVDAKISIDFKVSYNPDSIGGNTKKEYEDKVQENFKKVEPWCWIEKVGLISKFIFLRIWWLWNDVWQLCKRSVVKQGWNIFFVYDFGF